MGLGHLACRVRPGPSARPSACSRPGRVLFPSGVVGWGDGLLNHRRRGPLPRIPRWRLLLQSWTGPASRASGSRASGPPDVLPSDLAMVLCTSGSTAAPKGVRMTHARAVVWARANAAKAPVGTVPAIVSWLPFFHIGGLGPLFEVVAPVDWHILPMGRFVRDPAEWLRLAGKTRRAFHRRPVVGLGSGLAELGQEARGCRPVVPARCGLQRGDRRP